MADRVSNEFNFRLIEDGFAELARAIIDYEAASRGLTRGQAAYELVAKAADTGSYPEEIREKLAEAARDRRARAVMESLAAISGENVA